MYYYSYLDKSTIKEYAELAGKAGHQIRNLCSGYVRIEYPELQIIDNLSGQIEGICRDIIGHISNNADIKPLIRNSIRPSICLFKILNENSDYLAFIDKESLIKIKELLLFQCNSLKEIDQLINNAILEDSKINFNENIFKNNYEKEVIIKYLNENFGINNEIIKLKEPILINKFIEINKETAKFLCNNAHEIQNYCSSYIHKAPENALTNKMINIAGQIENRSRAMQDLIANHKPLIVGNKIDYFNKAIASINDNCYNIGEHIKEISEIAIDEKCPIKITDEKFHNLLSREHNLTEILTENFKIGYIL